MGCLILIDENKGVYGNIGHADKATSYHHQRGVCGRQSVGRRSVLFFLLRFLPVQLFTQLVNPGSFRQGDAAAISSPTYEVSGHRCCQQEQQDYGGSPQGDAQLLIENSLGNNQETHSQGSGLGGGMHPDRGSGRRTMPTAAMKQRRDPSTRRIPARISVICVPP